MGFKPPVHGRDHCVGGADPIPCLESIWARAEKTYSSSVQNIPTASNTDVVWTGYQNLDVGDSGLLIYEEDLPPLKDIIVRAQGVYIVKAFVIWDVTTVGEFRGGISKGIGGTIDWLIHADTTLFGGQLEFSGTALMHLAGTEELSLVLYHEAGADRGLDAAFLHVARVGQYTGEIWENMNPDHP